METDQNSYAGWVDGEHRATLISCFEQRLLVEVDRAGKEVAKHQVGGRPFTIRRY